MSQWISELTGTERMDPAATAPSTTLAPLDAKQDDISLLEKDDGTIAVVVITVVSIIVILAALAAIFIYRQFVHRNATSMNFDNPVYRKTTEDQFALQKNQLPASRTYPSAPGEETLEPLTSPGTSEYV